MSEKFIQFPGQYNGFRVTTIGDRVISLRVDQAYAETIKDIITKNIGTEFIVTLVDVTSETNFDEERRNDVIRERFYKKMHALINELADIRGKTQEETKDHLKHWLIEKKLIENSTKELSIKGIAIANNYLDRLISKYGTDRE